MPSKKEELGSQILGLVLVALLGIVLTVVLAPWVFRITQSINLTSGYPFRRIFNRVFLGSEIFCFVLFWRRLKLEAPWKVYFKVQHFRKEFWHWFLVAVITMAILTALQYLAGFRDYRPRSFSYLLSKGSTALLSALLVAFIEEIIFRGLLLTALRARYKTVIAVIITSLIFAGLHIFSLDHFIQGIKKAVGDFNGTEPLAGLYHLGLFLKPITDFKAVVPGFIGLFVCSLMLCTVTVRNGSLWSAIASHFGWVFTIKITGRVLAYNKDFAATSSWQWLLGEKFVATSVLGWIFVLIETFWIVGLFGYSVFLIMRLICEKVPRKKVLKLAEKIGSVMYYLALKKKLTALDNIRHAFPEKTEKEVRKIAKESFQNLARTAFCVVLMPKIAAEKPCPLTSLHYDRLAKAHTKGPGGVVFFTAHFGNWECQSWASTIMGANFMAVGRPFRNRLIYQKIAQLREGCGVKLVEKRQAVKPLLQTLRKGGEIGLVADQYAGSDGVPTIFFGRVCSTSPSPAFLARRTHCPIVPAFCRNLPNGDFQAYIYEPFFVDETDNPEEDIRKATQRAMDCLENEIRLNPGSYLWAHRKWRSSFTKKHQLPK